jgi:predicted DCC family thiol-disulfide oxidoreductase YuxK
LAAIILFDGVCNLCNGSVQFIIRHDPRAHFHFAALQSAEAQQLLADAGYNGADLSSVVLLEDGKVYERSAAALRIARNLSGGWKLLTSLVIVPRPIRDLVYNWIARNRYSWFGKRDECMIPTPELRNRFIDGGG